MCNVSIEQIYKISENNSKYFYCSHSVIYLQKLLCNPHFKIANSQSFEIDKGSHHKKMITFSFMFYVTLFLIRLKKMCMKMNFKT